MSISMRIHASILLCVNIQHFTPTVNVRLTVLFEYIQHFPCINIEYIKLSEQISCGVT